MINVMTGKVVALKQRQVENEDACHKSRRKRKGQNKGLQKRKSRAKKNSIQKAKGLIKIPLPDPAGEDVEMQTPVTPLITINLETGIADVKMVEAGPGAMHGEDHYENVEDEDAIMEEDAEV